MSHPQRIRSFLLDHGINGIGWSQLEGFLEISGSTPVNTSRAARECHFTRSQMPVILWVFSPCFHFFPFQRCLPDLVSYLFDAQPGEITSFVLVLVVPQDERCKGSTSADAASTGRRVFSFNFERNTFGHFWALCGGNRSMSRDGNKPFNEKIEVTGYIIYMGKRKKAPAFIFSLVVQ